MYYIKNYIKEAFILKFEMKNIPVVFRKIDSLGKVKDVFPKIEVIYEDLYEAGSIRLGYISGERVEIYFNYSWLKFLRRFWLEVLGIIIVGGIIDILAINFVTQVWKQHRMKMSQRDAFQQQLHDMISLIASMESVLYKMYLDASSAKNEKSCIERGMNMAVQLKQIVAKTLGLAVMLYTKQVQWEKINLRYALESLSDEFKLANKYEKEVHITIKYFLPEFHD